jgi:hypothetical protein
MNDLIARLREIEDSYLDETPRGYQETCGEAADKIERLRAALESIVKGQFSCDDVKECGSQVIAREALLTESP